jgi:uncharacterized protein YciI
MKLDEFQLVLLRRPPNPTEYDEEASARIQREHLTYYASLRATGAVVTNGPVRDQPDQSLRGLVIFATESLDRAREFAERDPSVLAGRLTFDLMTWWCPPDTMIRAGLPITIDD